MVVTSKFKEKSSSLFFFSFMGGGSGYTTELLEFMI